MCTPDEVICYLRVLQQVDQKVHRVLPGQGAVAVHDDVEHELERLVDVFAIEELRRKHEEEVGGEETRNVSCHSGTKAAKKRNKDEEGKKPPH